MDSCCAANDSRLRALGERAAGRTAAGAHERSERERDPPSDPERLFRLHVGSVGGPRGTRPNRSRDARTPEQDENREAESDGQGRELRGFQRCDRRRRHRSPKLERSRSVTAIIPVAKAIARTAENRGWFFSRTTATTTATIRDGNTIPETSWNQGARFERSRVSSRVPGNMGTWTKGSGPGSYAESIPWRRSSRAQLTPFPLGAEPVPTAKPVGEVPAWRSLVKITKLHGPQA